MFLNNPYISQTLGAVATPYQYSWQLDHRTPESFYSPSVEIVNTFLDTIEKLGILA